MHSIRKPRGRAAVMLGSLLAVAGASIVVAAPAWAADEQPAPPPSNAKPTALDEATDLVMQEDAARGTVGVGEIVVSAEGGGVPLKYAGARDVIDAETISRYAGGNVSDVIRRVPGFYVTQQTDNEAYINVGSRGLSPHRSRYVGFLLDGLPLAMAPYGLNDKDIFPVTMDRISRIDSIRGGAALRYGPHAVGGVINLISPAIPESPTVFAKVRYGSNSSYSTMVHAGGTWGPLGVSLIEVEKGGDGFRDHSEYDIGDFYGRVRYRIDERNSLLFTLGRYMIDAELPGTLTPAEYEDDPDGSNRDYDDNPEHDRSRASRTMYAVTYEHDFGRRTKFDLTFFYQDGFNEVDPSAPSPGPVFTKYSTKPTWSDTLNMDARFTWDMSILGMRNTFSHLLYVNRENAENLFEAHPLPSGAVTVDQHAKFHGRGVALFTEDAIDITDTLQATLGIRFEQIEMSSKSQVPEDDGAGRFEDYTLRLPAESLAWEFAPRMVAFAGRQDSFRPPYYDNFDPTSESYYNEGGIQPELARSREVGLRVRDFHGFDAQVTSFRTNFEDLIVVVPFGDVNKFVNVGTAVSSGVESSLSFDFGTLSESLQGLSAYITRTRQDSTITSGDFKGNDQPYAPHKLGSWGVEYEHASGVWVRVDGTSSGSSFAQQENFDRNFDHPTEDGVQGKTPAFRVWDVSAGWREHPDGTGLSVVVGMTNAFDTDIFLRNNGIVPAPGRQVFATVSYTLRF